MCVFVSVCTCDKPVTKRNGDVLPSSDEEEEGKDDQQGKAAYRCCDNHQNLTLVSNIKICGKWDKSQGEADKTNKYVPGNKKVSHGVHTWQLTHNFMNRAEV